MAIAASPTVTSLPSMDLSITRSGLQHAVAALSDVIAQLQAQSGTGALAGAATLGGGAPGTPMQAGGGWGAGVDAVDAVDQIDPPPKGAKGAPKAKKVDKAAAGKGASTGDMLVAEAKSHLGAKYVAGGTGPNSFDCSGLIMATAKKLGIKLPRIAAQQAHAGKAVARKHLQPGDLVYFSDGGSVSHIGMFVGNGKYIHAPKPGDVVKIERLDDSWSASHYKGARRIT